MAGSVDKEAMRVTKGKMVSLATLKIIISRITAYLNLGQFFMVYLILAIPYIQGAFWTLIGAVVIGLFFLLLGWWDFNNLFGVENEVTSVQNPFVIKYYNMFHKLEENQTKILKRLEQLEKSIKD